MNEKLREFNVEFLFSAVLELKTMEECYKFFEDLCTVQELKALAQRIQVAKMLSENKVYSDIVAETEWWETAVLTGKVCLNDRQTFFVRQGDIVGRLCVFFSVLLLLGVAVRVKVRK